MDSVSFDYIINALIRHGHLAVTIAALSFGLAPLQLAVQSGSNDNARSIGLALVATNFFIRGYTLSLHLSSARESVSASLQEGAAAALAADNRGPPGFELGDEEREEDDDHDHENGKNSVQGLEPHGPVDLIVDEQDGLSGEEQEARAKLSSLSPPSSIIDHDTVHSQHLSSAATRLVFVPPYTHPVTGIVVPGGWLDEQQLRRALAQHTTTSERGYTSLLLTTCLERWSCACCCNDSSIGLTVTPAFSNVLVAQISNLIDYARKVVQTSPLIAFSSIMTLSLSLCLPALVGSVLSSYFLHHQSSASPSQIPQQAAISIGLISLASAAIVHASEQDLRYLRLHWRRRLFDMPRVWRRSVVKLDDIRYGRGSDGPQITTTHNVDKNRRLERLVQKKQSSSSPQSPILPNNNEVIAIQNQVLRQLLFCLLAPALIVSGLKAAVATTNSSSVLIQSTPTSSIFSSMSESLNIGITTAVLLTTLFVPMIIPLIITLCYQSVGLVAMPYLCSQKWMLWLLEFLQATLQAGALVLLLAPSVLVEGGGLVGAVAGSVCSAIVFLFASSFLILVASIGFNTFCCRVRDQKIKTSTSAPTITKASIKRNKSNKIDAENTAARPSDGTLLLSRSDVIYSIFSLSGRSLSSGLALAYALSPVSQTPPFSLSQPFRTSLLLDGLLSFRAGVALSFTFYIIAQFTIFYIMDEFLRAAAFINRLKKSHEHAERDALDAISAINDASSSSSSSSLYVSSSSDKNATTSSSSSSSPLQYSSSSSSSSFPLTNQPGSSRLPFTPTPITPTSSSSSSSISSRLRNESISPEQRVQILADLVRQMQSPDHHHHHHHHLRHQHRQQHQQQQKQQLPMPSFVSTHDSVSSSMSQQFVRHHAFPLSPYSLQQSHHRSSHVKTNSAAVVESVKHNDSHPGKIVIMSHTSDDKPNTISENTVVDEIVEPAPPTLSSSESQPQSLTVPSTDIDRSVGGERRNQFVSTRFNSNNNSNNNTFTAKNKNNEQALELTKQIADNKDNNYKDPISVVRRVRDDDDTTDEVDEEDDDGTDVSNDDDDDDNDDNIVPISFIHPETVLPDVGVVLPDNKYHHLPATTDADKETYFQTKTSVNSNVIFSPQINNRFMHSSAPDYAAVPDPSGIAPFILVAIKNNDRNEDIDLNLSMSTSSSSFVNRLESVAMSTTATAPAGALSSLSLLSSSASLSSSPSLTAPNRRRPISRETLSHK